MYQKPTYKLHCNYYRLSQKLAIAFVRIFERSLHSRHVFTLSREITPDRSALVSLYPLGERLRRARGRRNEKRMTQVTNPMKIPACQDIGERIPERDPRLTQGLI
jgi:hypothetical protein